MVGVDEFGTLDASRAEIPVRTVEAFVTNSVDELRRVSLKISVEMLDIIPFGNHHRQQRGGRSGLHSKGSPQEQ